MFIPKNIHELLDERIQFCETVLNGKDKISESPEGKNMIVQFNTELKNFRKIKELLSLVTNPGTMDVTEARQQFYTEASEMMNKLIGHCRQQLENVSDLVAIHQMLNLIEALNKINQQLSQL